MLRPDGTSTSPHIADKDTRNAAFICLASASSVMGLLDPDHKDADYPLVLTRLSTAAVKGKKSTKLCCLKNHCSSWDHGAPVDSHQTSSLSGLCKACVEKT